MQAGSSQRFRVTDGSHTRPSRQTDDARVRWGGDRGDEDRKGGRQDGGKRTIFFLFCWAVWYVVCACVCDGVQADRYPTCLDLLSVCLSGYLAPPPPPLYPDDRTRQDKTGEGRAGQSTRHDVIFFLSGSFFSFAACLVSGAGDIYHDVSGVGQARGVGGVVSLFVAVVVVMVVKYPSLGFFYDDFFGHVSDVIVY